MAPSPRQFPPAFFAVLAAGMLLGCGSAAQQSPPNEAFEASARRQTPAPGVQDVGSHAISITAMGGIQLGTTLGEARRSLPGATFERTSDGDGAALVQVTLAKDEAMILWADEDTPEAPIAWANRIKTIETFSSSFQTAEGVHPGSLVADARKVYGTVTDVVLSEIESREYVRFARQPAALTFRVEGSEPVSDGARRTTRLDAGARIISIAVSSYSRR